MRAHERELQNRILRREVNERIAGLMEGFHDAATGELPITVFCECGSETCMAPIETTLAEYRAVRAGPSRWVVSGAHIDAALDSIIARRNGYALIDRAPEAPPGQAPPSRKEPTSPLTTNLSER